MEISDFAEAFFTVHGHEPFPWQKRLAETLCITNEWPGLIGVPTGCGKTATLDVALFHLAWCAHRGMGEQLRRRIVFVVNRRVIVDEAYERAKRLERAMEQALSEHNALGRWARALTKLGGDRPLEAWRLRGGVPKERGYASDPTQPLLVSATVDQIGSRLLFRGYGVRDYSKPIHAGLLGWDTLILADEAHLAAPFLDTINQIAAYQGQHPASEALPAPVSVVQLTATGQENVPAFSLDDQDHRHPILTQRLQAHKPTSLVQLGAREAMSDRLAREAVALATELSTEQPNVVIAVVANRVSTARRVFDRIRSQVGEDTDTALFIGRARPYDRNHLMERWVPRLKAGRQAQPDERPAIIVATQTIEVGADFDFHGLVTELAAWDALRQRFGRLNRLGVMENARGCIISPGTIPSDDPIYGDTLAPTWAFLQTNAEAGGVLDLSLNSITQLQQVAPTQITLAPAQGPILTHSFIELLAQTSPRPDPDIEAAPFLHGFERGEPEVQMVFRGGLEVNSQKQLKTSDAAKYRLEQYLDALPPTSGEVLSLPRSTFLHWIASLDEAKSDALDLSDIEGSSIEEQPRRGRRRLVWSWSGEEVQAINSAGVTAAQVIVIPSEWGGCDAFGFAPGSKTPVADIAESALATMPKKRRRAVLMPARIPHLHWLTAGDEGDTGAPDPLVAMLGHALDQVAENETNPQVTLAELLGNTALQDRLRSEIKEWLTADDRAEVTLLRDAADIPFAFYIVYGKPKAEDLSDEDSSSSRSKRQYLNDHSTGVKEWAQRLLKNLQLSESLRRDIATAAWLHDIGKAEPRFQRMLGGEPDEKLLAKSDGKGGSWQELGDRHEFYSASLILQNPSLIAEAKNPQLIIHLVGSHHGRGRGLMPCSQDIGRDFSFRLDGKDIQHRGPPGLGNIGSGWAERFWSLNNTYGAWGLAFLETLLRLADHRRSAEEAGQ